MRGMGSTAVYSLMDRLEVAKVIQWSDMGKITHVTKSRHHVIILLEHNKLQYVAVILKTINIWSKVRLKLGHHVIS